MPVPPPGQLISVQQSFQGYPKLIKGNEDELTPGIYFPPGGEAKYSSIPDLSYPKLLFLVVGVMAEGSILWGMLYIIFI